MKPHTEPSLLRAVHSASGEEKRSPEYLGACISADYAPRTPSLQHEKFCTGNVALRGTLTGVDIGPASAPSCVPLTMNFRDLASCRGSSPYLSYQQEHRRCTGPVRDRPDHTAAPAGQYPEKVVQTASERSRLSGQSVSEQEIPQCLSFLRHFSCAPFRPFRPSQQMHLLRCAVIPSWPPIGALNA